MVTTEERCVALFSAMAEGFIFRDVNGHFETCNQSAERILGVTTAQMAGFVSTDHPWRAIHEDGSPFPAEAHPAIVTLRTGQPQSGVMMGVQKPDRPLIWISINTQPILRDGKLDGVVTALTDLTDRKGMARALGASLDFHA